MTEERRATVRQAVADAHRREWGFVLAATVRVAGDLNLAEECVQDAFVAALETWQRTGVPDNAGAWLTTTARHRAIDVVRREQRLRGKLPLLVDAAVAPGLVEDPAATLESGEAIADDRLRLVFTCCHPSLAPEAQVALTLRLVCGLTTAEIARAFLVSESTMAARITRAKKKISGARIPYRVPPAHELAARLDAVLGVVHLLFTTGHTAPAGPTLVRTDLASRALALARVLRALMPDEPEVAGLLALLLFTDARRATRADQAGRFTLLEDQDRLQWDQAEIQEGLRLLTDAMRGGRVGTFGLQAAIASVHVSAATYADTDWIAIRNLYDALLRVWPSPVVALNRAVAVAFADGLAAGLSLVDELAENPQLAGYSYLFSTRADLLRRLGHREAAAAAYRQAIVLTTNEAELAFLRGRLSELSD